MYMEGQPERDLRKELRVQERRQRREERQAQRVRELEEALTQENNDGEETAAKEKKSTGFLEGTLLVPPEAKKKKYAHWKVTRFFRDGIKPKPGYYIIPDSVKVGVNKITGYSYIYYMERRLTTGAKSPGDRIFPKWESDFLQK